MRTTLTLDDDVAAAIEQRRRERRHSLKQEVNELIRVGLMHVDEPTAAGAGFRVEPLNIGECLVNDFDDVSALLAMAEGEDYH
jgi:hypothetical protein